MSCAHSHALHGSLAHFLVLSLYVYPELVSLEVYVSLFTFLFFVFLYLSFHYLCIVYFFVFKSVMCINVNFILVSPSCQLHIPIVVSDLYTCLPAIYMLTHLAVCLAIDLKAAQHLDNIHNHE